MTGKLGSEYVQHKVTGRQHGYRGCQTCGKHVLLMTPSWEVLTIHSCKQTQFPNMLNTSQTSHWLMNHKGIYQDCLLGTSYLIHPLKCTCTACEHSLGLFSYHWFERRFRLGLFHHWHTQLFVADGTKPLPEPKLTYYLWSALALT